MNRKQIRDEIFNIEFSLKTKPMNEEERNDLKEKLEYYRKELKEVLYEEVIKKYEEQKKEEIDCEIKK